MKYKFLILILCLCLISTGILGCAAGKAEPAPSDVVPEPTQEHIPVPDPIDDNYRTFYQIFVGSFSDANRDGIGDLRGIINRMDYLNDGDITSGKSLGIQGIWLSPIFSSPSYHKYDVKDYYEIDWRFGTESDLVELIELCHGRNVKLILDLVINHTSSQHEWFLQFKAARAAGDAENPYYDYYSCVTEAEKIGGVTYQKISGVDCWYECNFSPDMPELNFDNPAVRQEVLELAKYYLDLGVDGFRFDAVKYVYFADKGKSVDFWAWYMEELRKMNPDIYCVGECWSGESESLEYCSAMNCFNFTLAQAEGMAAKTAKGANISKYTSYITSYQDKLTEMGNGTMPISFLSNHDMDRIAGAFAMENYMRMAANLYLLAPGSPFIYYGEEIGIRGSRGSENTDANRRLAMLWGDDDTIRNPVGSTYPESKQISTTVAGQAEDPNSLYSYYCRLLAIRHAYPEIARGDYTALECGSKNLGGYLITYGESSLVLLHNTSLEEESYDLAKCKGLAGMTVEEMLDTIGMGSASLEGSVLTLSGQTSVLLGP